MKTAQAVLSEAADLGVYLFVEQGKLKFKAPGGLPPALKQALGAHKAEVIALLENERHQQAEHQSQLPGLSPMGLQQAPLSFSQQRLWLVNKMAGGSTEYNLPMALRIDGNFDIDAAERAMNQIVVRHQSLRTVFAEQDNEPVQRVIENAHFVFVRHDLTDLPKQQREERLTELMAVEGQQLFDFGHDLMVRGRYIALESGHNQQSVLFLTMHHIASDGWSMGILVKEFIQFYQQQLSGQTADIAPLGVQYIDYAHWQRQWLAGSVLQNQLSYWQTQLADAPVIHDMVLDYPRPVVKSYQGAQVSSVIGHDLISSLESLARQHHMTLFMVLHGALSLLVSRYSHSTDIIIGTPMANRHQVELESLIGFFINTLPLRISTDFAKLDDFLSHVKQVNLDAQTHQDVPLEYLVEHCNVARSASHMPLVEVQFSMDSTEMGGLDLPGVNVSELTMQAPVARWDLNVAAQLNGQGEQRQMRFDWVYYTKVFSEQTINNMAEQFNALLSNLSGHSELARVSLFNAEQSRYLTHKINEVAVQNDVLPQLLHHRISLHASEHPDSPAIVSDDGNLSYAQLDTQANQLAHFLRTKDIGPDTLVGVCLERGAAAMIAILAVLKAGGAYVPLDPNYPLSRLEFMMEDAAIEVVLTDSELMQTIEFEDMSLVLLDEHLREQFYGNLPEQAPKVDGLNAEHLAYVIYTSGSTGQPKGVMITHQGAVNMGRCEQAAYGVDASSQVLQFASLNFDASVMEWVMALCHGATLHIVDDNTKRTPDRLSDYLLEHKISHTLLPPALLHHLPLRHDHHFKALLVGGEACDQHLVDRWSQHYPMFNAYGPTEITVFATTGQLTPNQPVHIGKTVANTRLYVVDGQGALVPFGAVGQLCVSGMGLARGYVNLPEQSAAKFVANPFVDENDPEYYQRLYYTGDLVRYLPGGELKYVGRADEQVKIRGFRIELGDVEHHLNQVDGVASSLLLVNETQPGQKHLVGYIVPNNELSADDNHAFVQQVRQQLKAVLPEHAIPSAIVAVAQWPLTPGGKIDRANLPAVQANQLQGEYIAPSNDMERQLVAIWAGILQLDASDLSVNGNFFELGGHSLLAVRLIADIREAMALELNINQLFSAPTIEDLAALLVQIKEDAADVVTDTLNLPLRTKVTQFEPSRYIDGDVLAPLSFAQQRLWFLDQLEQGSAHYNMSLAMAVKGPLDLALTEQALSRVIERHQSLRSRFVEVDGEPMQRIASNFNFKLTRIDLSTHSEDKDALVKKLVIEDASKVFDLSRDLMIRASWIELPPQQGQQCGVLLFNMHHIASDGWSMGVMIKDFVDFYNNSQIEPLSLQYADYATWQRDWLSGEVLQQQLNYWTSQLADVPSLHDIRLAHPRPVMKAHQGAAVSSVVPVEVSDAIERLAKAHQMTPFMLIHSALALVLSAHSNNHDIVVGTPVANRLQGELEPLIGFFVNTLVLRVNTRAENLSDYLSHVRQVNLDAQAHQDIPFEQLVDHCNVPRNTSHTPLFQILFTMDTNSQSNLSIPGVAFNQLDDAQSVAKFDIDIGARITEQGIMCSWVYDVALFDEQQIATMSDHLNALLGQWAKLVVAEELQGDYQARKETTEQQRGWLGANMVAPIESAAVKSNSEIVDDCQQLKTADISILSPSQQRHLLFDCNDTALDFDQQQMLHQRFVDMAKNHGDNVALVAEGASLSYAQLDARANQLAHGLRQAGVVGDAVVALCLPRSVEMVVAILAVLKAGGGYLPIEPEFPRQRIEYLLKDANVKVAITTSKQQGFADVEHLFALDTDCCNHQPTDALPIENHSRQLAYVIYTSGSTGQPKGVMIEHRAIVNRINWMQSQYQLGSDDNVLQKTPYSFDVSLWEFIWTLSYGATLVLAKPQGHKDPEYLAGLIEQQNISVLHFVPSMLAAYCSVMGERFASSLRYVICSGEALPLPLAQSVVANNDHIQLINLYGPTEAAVDVSHFNCSTDLAGGGYNAVPIGRPIDNIGLYVMDQNQCLLPQGTAGELCIGGVGLARGYLNNPAQTEDKFVDVSLTLEQGQVWQQRLYRTGDIVRMLPDGQIEYIGREDSQVKVRGLRIELAEIEHVLRQLEWVEDAHVLVNSNSALVAMLLAQDDNLSQIERALTEMLPEHMLPQQLLTLAQWPLSDNGKIDRKALALQAADKAGQNNRTITVASTNKQILLAKTWAEVLEMDWQEISIDDNFFALGGHSLLLIRYKALLRDQGFELPVAQLYNQQSIIELEPLLRQAQQLSVPPMAIPLGTTKLQNQMLSLMDLDDDQLVLIEQQVNGGVSNIADVYPLTGLQQGMLFHALAEDGGDPYLLRNLFKCQNKAQFEAFVAALNEVIIRHDALRTQIVFEGLNQPVQVVCRQFELPLRQVSIDSTIDAKSIGEQLSQNLPAQSMLYSRKPLIALDYCEHQGQYYLLLLNHHVVEDNLSIRQIGREIQAILNGQQADLPTPVPYRELVYRHSLQNQAEAKFYFEQYLQGFSEISAPGYQNDAADGSAIELAERADLELNQQLTGQLQQRANELQVSVNALLHLAWAMVVGQTSDRLDVVFGTVISGRMADIDGIERMVGMCINTLPLRVKLDGAPLGETLQQLHQDLAMLAEFEHVALAQVQQYSELEGHAALFNSILNCRMQYDKADDEQAADDYDKQGISALGGQEFTNYPYTAAADFDGQNLTLSVESQIHAANPNRLLEYFAKAVQLIGQQPLQTDINTLALLSTDELQRQATWLSGETRGYPQQSSIIELFEQQVRATPDAPALVCQGQSYSYFELNRRANQLAHYLQQKNPQLKQRAIGIAAQRSAEMVICALAVLKTRGFYVPLDLGAPQQRWQQIADDCDMALVLLAGCEFSHADRAVVDVLAEIRLIEVCAEQNIETAEPCASETLAYMIYTSGSTGVPKGVQISQQALCSFVCNNNFIDHERVTTVLGVSSFAFDVSAFDVFYTLLNGKTLLLAQQSQILDFDFWQQGIDQYRANTMFMTTSLFNLVVTEQPQMLAKFDQLMFGGEQGSSDKAAIALSHMTPTGGRLINVYGPTETTVFASFCPLDEHNVTPLSIGGPLANQQLMVLDSLGRTTPQGTVGQLYIGGAGLAEGYFNDPQKTADSFVELNGGRWYKSGDLVRLDDNGLLYFVGRVDQQLKIRGFRIEVAEIEQQLDGLDEVKQSRVQAVQGPGGDKVLVAYVQLSADVSVEAIKTQLQQLLPQHMQPAVMLTVEQFELNSNGKIDNSKLPPVDFASLQVAYEAPQSKTERALADIWAELLDITPAQVSRLANFFDLGGHSLLVVRLASAISRDLALKIDVRQVFEQATLADLAAMIDSVTARNALEQSLAESADTVQEMVI